MSLPIRVLCPLVLLTLVAANVLVSPAAAQTAGQNVNMVSGTQWPNGDPFLQRQNEPSMAVSTRNPMHILAGANDYRTVDLEMVLTGGAETGDAWLGLFKSFDGGYTWQSNLLPGCPYAVAQCKDSGALNGGYQAGADPVVRAGTNGMFYYAGLAFDRATGPTTASSVSSIFVARYNDLNNNENLDPITYIDTHIVATGNSSQFLDKPAMAVDIPRSGAATCTFTANEPGAGANGGSLAVKQSFAAGNVYLAYTDFLAATKANSTPTHLMFTHSTDCGVTWSTPIQINSGTTTSQGSAIAVNPITGAVYVAWRQFSSTGVSNAIMIAQSTNAGKGFSAPVQISTFQPFDQGTTGTSIRTNAYPALTTDMFGFVYVAFSARGVSSSGDARIVAAGSIDGTHWTPAIMVDNPPQSASNPSGRGHQIMPAMTFANGRLTLLYYDLRLDHYAGFYTPNAANPGTYLETLTPEGELASPNPEPSEVFTTYIDDAGLTLRRHTLDLRVLELGIFPTVVLGPSVLVSQYDYGCCVNPEAPDIEQFKFNVPNLPLFDQGEEPFLGDYLDIVPTPMFLPTGNSWAYNFMPSVNPLFHATWTDNRDVVPPPPGGSWEVYTPPVPTGTMSVFDPGNPLPACIPGQEGMRNQNIYTSQITGGLVVGAPGNAKPLGTTTFNGATVPFQRAFPVEAQNVTGQSLTVRFTIANQPTGGTASFLQFSTLTTLDITIPPYSSVSRSVFATSTNTQATITVNVAQITAIGGSVVTNGLSSSAVLNPDITNPNITNPNITNPNITNPNITNAEVTNPNITNPNITNPNITNPNITNPNITNAAYLNPNITNPNITNLNVDNISATNPNITNPNITNPNITNPNITNPNITNPNITNPDITNGSIQDVVYPITNNGNTTASYTVKAATNTVVPNGILLQLIIDKLYQTPVAVKCQLGVQTHWITVANIVSPKLFGVADPNITNPDITNGTPNEASVTLAPGETAYITLRVVNPTPAATPFNPLTAITPVTVPQAVNTTTVLANPGNPNLTAPPVYPPLTVLTATLPSTDRLDAGYSVQLQATGGKPGVDTWSTVSGGLPPGITLGSSGLVSGSATTPGTYTATIQVADSSVPPNVAVQTYTVNVSVTPLTEQFVLVPPSGVVGQPYVDTPLAVNGGTPPYVWTATGLPAGLNINSSTGQIGGTPTTAVPGGVAVKVTATDAAFPAESVSYNTTIAVGNPLAIGPATLPNGNVGVAYTAQLTATGGIGGYVFGPPAPATGVALSGNGQLTIANPQVNTLTITVSVHDGSQPTFQSATATYTITFAGTPSLNVLYITQPPNYVEGQTNPGTPVHIHVQDNQGAALAGVNVTMSFNGTPPCATAVLSDTTDTLTQTTNATGDVFFTYMTINRGGVGYALNATAGTIVATSNPFNVSGYCDTGSMNTARHNHIVLPLQSGKVLITGGAVNPDSTGVLASAEVYDPVAHTFTTVGPMNVARADHTMTLLNDGTVLVAGGFNDTGAGGSVSYTNTAEIFNPTTQAFTLLPATMTTQRGEHSATLLANGTVLLAGGNTLTATLQSAEIYDPVAKTFTATPQAMTTPRQILHADLLPNGKVLVSGGLDVNNNALATAEIYDPVAQTFTATPGNMTTARGNHGSALLYNGQVLVAGGLTGPGTALTLTATAELFNPATGTFTPTGSMSVARGHYTAPALSDGTIFIPSGATPPAGINADIYNPATGTFTATPNFTATTQAGLREGMLPDGTVLLASGINTANNDVAVPNSEVYYPVPLAPGIVFTTAATLPPAFVNQQYTQMIQEHGGVGRLFWAANPLPPGMALTANGILTGTPGVLGSYGVTVTVMDSSTPPQTATMTFTFQVENPLVITTATLPAGLVGVGYNAPIVSTGGAQPVFFSVATTAFPPGLTITQPTPGSQTGALAGTPTTPGTYSFSEGVADSSSPQQTATQPYTVTIANPIAITTTTLPNAPTDTGAPAIPYNAQIQTSGGLGGLTFAITSGALPTGIALNTTTGALTGTSVTAAVGTYNFTVQVTSAGPPSSTANAALSITTVPFFNGGTPNTLPSGTTGTPYTYTITSTGGVPPFSYSLLSGTPPAGLTLNSATATTINLSGLPTAAGTSMFFISASDSSSPPQGYTEALTVTINGAVGAVAFTSQPSNSTGGQTIGNSPINVLVTDTFTNPVAGINVGIAFGTAACSSATLSGTVTATTNASGVASFSNLSIDRGQNGYTLQATAGGVSSASNAFNVAGFCPTGNLNTARANSVAVALPNGNVLVAGGNPNPSVPAVNTAELYSAGSFAALTATMNSPRASFSGTLLGNGSVLLAGGINGGGTSVNSVETYTNGAFALDANNMSTPRDSHTATLLANGNVLIAGGENGFSNDLNTAEIYNSANGTFSAPITMTSAHVGHTATLFTSGPLQGQVLIVGGDVFNGSTNVPTNVAELYNPATNTFTATGSLNVARSNQVAVLLPNGKVLIAGGLNVSNMDEPTAEIYDPTAKTFSFTGSPVVAEGNPTATLLANGQVLMLGGTSTLGQNNEAQIYDPTSATWSAILGMISARADFPVVTLNNNTVLISGGYVAPGSIANAEIYYPGAAPIQINVNVPLPNAPNGAALSATVPYSAQIPTVGGYGGASTFSITGGALPGSMTLNSATGAITSTNVNDGTLGTYNFTVQVVSAGPPSSTSTANLSITEVPLFAGTTPNTLPGGNAGVAYSVTLTSTGGVPPFSYQYSSGSLPPGLSVAGGVLSGTPTAGGTFNFFISASDSSAPPQVYSESLTVTIAPIQPPTNVTASAPNGGPSVQLNWTASVTSNVTSYNVYRSLTSGTGYVLAGSTPGAPFTDNGTTFATTYYYVVTAVKNGVESPYSNEASVMVPPHP